MKISYASIMMLLSMAALAIPNPEAYSQDRSAHALNMLEARKSCSGQRQHADKCSGKRLGPMNSFHNCKNMDGKCCALNKDGSGALDVSRGQGREDCGFCFTGKCKA
ncbi:hypothetical protein F9C07_2227011 [Aspergillus flavus]|uniref:Uncharacterized protein n=2 Tax=Aspergillus subgen. Circumdati TaxID=2720871 RepID=A0A7G5JT59_ASPFN|nr:hypothetical protein AFLA_002872 [Aspergillus flavus NRRL3357]OOO13553.1 hypothetical protein OAory_01013020 [Aspergillus oryzae]QMW38801.1 hypothetical protein G4B11_002037 [Aspergillus flavus]QRD87126.1 hypothetical protein F9C07_2227011 [Aspergillus flavus]UCK59336.1 hypothetical protein AFCA_002154 [Aspergillus flavus]